jgi:hypothetical protein
VFELLRPCFEIEVTEEQVHAARAEIEVVLLPAAPETECDRAVVDIRGEAKTLVVPIGCRVRVLRLRHQERPRVDRGGEVIRAIAALLRVREAQLRKRQRALVLVESAEARVQLAQNAHRIVVEAVAQAEALEHPKEWTLRWSSLRMLSVCARLASGGER